jgi:GxxExxY protein
MNQLPENDLAHAVIGFAIDIHKALGPGLSEDIYLKCLTYELEQHGLKAEYPMRMHLQYKDLWLENAGTIDILVDDKLIVEIETCDQISDFMIQKVLRNLKTGNYKLGLIINFNAQLLKNGIRRVSNQKLMQAEEQLFAE